MRPYTRACSFSCLCIVHRCDLGMLLLLWRLYFYPHERRHDQHPSSSSWCVYSRWFYARHAFGSMYDNRQAGLSLGFQEIPTPTRKVGRPHPCPSPLASTKRFEIFSHALCVFRAVIRFKSRYDICIWILMAIRVILRDPRSPVRLTPSTLWGGFLILDPAPSGFFLWNIPISEPGRFSWQTHLPPSPALGVMIALMIQEQGLTPNKTTGYEKSW